MAKFSRSYNTNQPYKLYSEYVMDDGSTVTVEFGVRLQTWDCQPYSTKTHIGEVKFADGTRLDAGYQGTHTKAQRDEIHAGYLAELARDYPALKIHETPIAV